MRKQDEIIRQYETGKISRRNFMKYLAGLGLSIPAVNSMLAKLGSEAMAATPVRGGRLRFAIAGGSQSEVLDPAKIGCSTDVQRCQSLYNKLVRATPDLTFEPELAESWEANKSADEWIFKLRKGVEWHNGADFKAQDVLYSLRRIMDPKTGSSARLYFTDVTDLRAEDNHTVHIRLAQPDVDFPSVFTAKCSHIVPDGFTDFDHAIGTGPFKLKSFKPGHGCLVERNPNYWKSGLPYVDEVESFSIPDNIARVNALLAGDIHLMDTLDPMLIDKVDASSHTKVLSTPSGYRVPFIMNCTLPPYDNPDVRMALKLLIDRERYNQIVYQGNAQIGNDHPVAPVYPDFCDEIPQRRHDPEKAKFLLKKAGFENFIFNLHVSNIGVGAERGALVYSDMAAKAGVKVKVVKEPTDGYWKAVWMKKAFLMCHWYMRPTAQMQLALTFKSDVSMNDTFWKRPDFDKLLAEARSTFDKSRRKALYCEMQRMVNQDGGTIIPSFVNKLDAVSARVKNISLSPIVGLGVFNLPEACWLEA